MEIIFKATIKSDIIIANIDIYILLFIGILLIIPSLSRNAKSLRFSSRLGFYSIILIIILIAVMVLYNSKYHVRNDSLSFIYNIFSLKDISSTNNSIATIILSFSFHSYAFSIYELLENKTTKKMMISSSIGIMISAISILFLGTTLYLNYGKYILTVDIFHILSKSSLGLIIIIFFTFSVLMSYPISFFSLKNYIFYLIPLIIELIKSWIQCCCNCCFKESIHEEHHNNHHLNSDQNNQEEIKTNINNRQENFGTSKKLDVIIEEDSSSICTEKRNYSDNIKNICENRNTQSTIHFKNEHNTLFDIKEQPESEKSSTIIEKHFFSKNESNNNINSKIGIENPSFKSNSINEVEVENDDENVKRHKSGNTSGKSDNEKDKISSVHLDKNENEKMNQNESKENHEKNNDNNIHHNLEENPNNENNGDHSNDGSHDHDHDNHHHLPELSIFVKDIVTFILFVGLILICNFFRDLKYVRIL